MSWVDVVVLLAYASLAVELVVFPIPSEASTLQLLASPFDGHQSVALARAQRRSLAVKLVLFVLPTAIGLGLFALPLLCVLWPAARAALGASPGPGLAVGLTAVVLGRILTFGSVLQLRAARRRGEVPAGGVFRWSRNPGLVGMFAFYLGLSLCYQLQWMWLGMPVYLVNMHHRVRLEEAHLLDRLGARWREYSRRVPRYVGRRGR